MIKLTHTKLLSFLCLLLAVTVLSSCKKDKDERTSQIQLLSYGPTGAMHGDTLRFFGTNLDKVTEVHFTGPNAVVKQSEFKKQDWEELLLIVPESAERGYVTLKTPQGDIVSKTMLNLSVESRVTQVSGPARPGETVTLTGNFLNWVKSVTFNKDLVVTNFVSQEINKLVVTIPETAQTGRLVLAFGGTDSSTSETDTLWVKLPVTTTMSPATVKPGTNLTITGTDLDLARKVIFTGVATPVTTFVSQSATQIVVAVPMTAKKGKLILEAASGVQTTSAADLDIVLPMATGVTPASVNLNGDVTIIGTNLDLVRKVIFSGVAAPVTTFVSQSATQIVVKAPAGARKGKVTLEAASGVQTQSTGEISVVLPTVTSFSPSPVEPGTNLTINGTRLDMVTSVTFQNAPAVNSFVSKSATQIVVRVPTGVLNGRVTLGISNPTDTVQSAQTLEIAGAAPPPTLAVPLYLDEVKNWSGWNGGWGGTKVMDNADPVREGTKSIKITYNTGGAYGSPFQLGAGNLSVGTNTTFKLSIYGAPGSNGKTIQVKLNGNSGPGFPLTVVEGKWTDHVIPFTSLGNVTSITEIWVQDQTSTGGYTIYVDAVGLN